MEYVACARGVWLSDRPLAERVRLLREMTEPVQTIYFERRWKAVGEIPTAKSRLRATLDGIKNSEQANSLLPSVAVDLG